MKKASSEEIVLLTARINALTKANVTTTDNQDSTNKRKTQRQGKRPPWVTIKPDDDDKKERGVYDKTVEGKKCHYCVHHHSGAGQWTIYHPSECRNKAEKPQDDDKTQVNVGAFDTEDKDEADY